MITATQTADLLGLSVQRVRALARQGRIRGAKRIGRDWLFPERPVIRPPRSNRGPATYR